jgi:hypothetical protein
MVSLRPSAALVKEAGLVVLGHTADAIMMMFRVPEACACQRMRARLKEQRRPDFSAANWGSL